MLSESSEREYLVRLEQGLNAASEILSRFTPGQVKARQKTGRELVTEADVEISSALRASLVRGDDGWLSEEDPDDHDRLARKHVWIVDPIDGTSEFVHGVPEYAVSIALAVDGVPIAGGVHNPATKEFFLGSASLGATYNGQPVAKRTAVALDNAVILASRSEFARGEWKRFAIMPGLTIRPTGSIAYKLARVAAGFADATWTLSPKHEWDVAAGIALVRAAGGSVYLDASPGFHFNSRSALLRGMVAAGPDIGEPLIHLLRRVEPDREWSLMNAE